MRFNLPGAPSGNAVPAPVVSQIKVGHSARLNPGDSDTVNRFPTHQATRAAGVALIAAGCLLAPGCTSAPDAAAPSTSTSPSTSAPPNPSTPVSSSTPSSSSSSSPSSSPDANALTIAISISGGQVTPNGKKINAKVGQTVQLSVTSDVDDEIHAHIGGDGYELEVPAGKTTTGSFPLTSAGSFEVESHHLEKVIVVLNAR